jgi:hypothetical protein
MENEIEKVPGVAKPRKLLSGSALDAILKGLQAK